MLAELLTRLDEGPTDVAVLDQPLAERNAGAPGEANGARDRTVGNGNDHIPLGRMLRGEDLAHALARRVHRDATEP